MQLSYYIHFLIFNLNVCVFATYKLLWHIWKHVNCMLPQFYSSCFSVMSFESLCKSVRTPRLHVQPGQMLHIWRKLWRPCLLNKRNLRMFSIVCLLSRPRFESGTSQIQIQQQELPPVGCLPASGMAACAIMSPQHQCNSYSALFHQKWHQLKQSSPWEGWRWNLTKRSYWRHVFPTPGPALY